MILLRYRTCWSRGFSLVLNILKLLVVDMVSAAGVVRRGGVVVENVG